MAEILEPRQMLATDALTDALAARPVMILLEPPGLYADLRHKKRPKPAITASVVAGPDTNGVVTIAGHTYARAKVKLDIGATGRVEQRVKADKHGRFQLTFPVGFGSTSVRLSATAARHKRTSTILAVNRLDREPPAIAVQGPSPGRLTRTEATFTGAVTDAGMGVASLGAAVDGGAVVPVPLGSAGNFAYTTTLPLDGSADGPHQVQFVAVDQAGNVGHSTGEPFTLDTRAPILTVTSPAPGLSTATNVTVTGHVADALSGIATLQAQVDGGAAVAVPFDAGGNFAYPTTLKLDGSADGLHTVSLTVGDGAGNTATASVSFTLSTRTSSSSIALAVTAPLDAGALSATGRLIGTVTETGPATPSAQFALDGGGFAPLPLDSSGHFDRALSATPLAVGSHTVTVQASDSAGHLQAQTIHFSVSSNFLVGAAGTIGWGEATSSAIHLEERDSLIVQYAVPMALGAVAQGTRTISFQVAARFDQADTTSLSGDRLLVSLVDPANPSQMLLSGSQPGTPLFALGQRGAPQLAPGLVSFDGTTVTIDVTSVKTVGSGLLVFQVVNTDADGGSVVDIRGLAGTVDPDGTSGSALAPPAAATAAAGPAVDLAALSKATGVVAQVSDVRFDPATGRYTASLQVMNTGAPSGRTIAVQFPGLPPGVTLPGASGTDGSGNPYVNMHDAIAPGGLGTGAVSQPVPITLSDPSLVRFALAPRILSTGPELPPVLAPIAPLTVMPGQVVNVPLQATDPNGDPITFSIRGSGPLPTSTLQPDGTLVLNPTPGDLGTYSFTVVASNGSQQATQPVSVAVVADANVHTRLSGVIQNTASQPLPGITIAVGSLTAVTASDGSFLLDFGASPPGPDDRLQVNGQQAGGATYPFIAEKIVLLLGHDVYAGANNAIARPIYLPPLDMADGKTVDPNRDTTVTTAMIPGAAVLVKAGTLKDQAGQPFTGVLSITQVPVNLTPAALPPTLKPSLVVTIQPGDMVFLQPAPLALPNAGYTPGTQLDLWSINPTTGFFDNVGVGRVSPDGSVIQTISGGIHNSSWHFFAPSSPAPGPAPPPASCPQPAPGGSQVDLFSGDVQETASLVGYQSLGLEHSLQLTYDSERAYPQPIVRAGYEEVDASSFSGFPQVVLMARLTVQEGSLTYTAPGYSGSDIPNLSGGERFWNLPTGSHAAYSAFQLDMANQPTGQYAYTEQIGFFGFSSGRSAVNGSYATTGGQIYLVNDINSPFGSGWDLAGLETLYPASDGSMMLVDGSGLVNVFQPPVAPKGAYVSQAGDFSTLVKLPDGTFQRTLTDQTVFHFNANNQLATITDRNGNVTTYAYDAGGHLATITDPVGLATHFTYTGNRITAITDPANRTTQLAYDADGNLATITNPDDSHTEYRYDARHHLIGETDPLGNQSQDFYDVYGRARRSIRKDGSVVTFNPVQVQGLQPPGGPFDPFHAPPAGTNTAVYVDGVGHVKGMTFNYAGFLVAQSDGAGSLGTAQLDSNFLVGVGTDGNGYTTTYTYDARGNVTSSQSAFSGQISGRIANPGDRDVYTFNATQGQRFFYEGLGTPSFAIAATLTDPSGQNLFNFPATSSSNTLILPETGIYQLTLAGNGPQTGTYRFRVLTPTQTVKSLTLDAPISGAIVNPGDQAVYTFDGTADERIFYDARTVAVNGQRVQLFDPLGNPVFSANWSTDEGPLTLTQSGPYRLLLSGDLSGLFGTTGSYAFRILDASAQPIPTLGATVSGTLSPGLGADVYQIHGTQGQRLSFHSLTPSAAATWTLYGTGDRVIHGGGFGTDFTVTLPAAGTDLLVVSGTDTGHPVPYSFQITDVSNPPQTPSGFGVVHSGSIDAGGTDTYAYNAPAGLTVALDAQTAAAGSLVIDLLDPSNKVVFSTPAATDVGATVLPRGGTYTLRVHGGSGSYRFNVLDLAADSTPLTLGTAVSVSLDAHQFKTYRFSGTAGERVFYNGTFPSVVLASLDGPSGNAFRDAFQSGPYTLPSTGMYILTVHDETPTSSGAYNFNLLKAALPITPLTLGTVVTGTLANPGDRAVYTFNGTAGQRILYDALISGPSGLNVLLQSPSGTAVIPDGTAATDRNLITLPEDGTYHLTISGPSGATGNYSFQLLDVTSTPAVPFGTTVSGTLNPGRSDALYTIVGTAGQRLYFQSLTPSSPFQWNLFRTGPSSSLVGGSSSVGADFVATLPYTGRYDLVLSTGSDAPVNYSFRVTAPATPVQPLSLGATVQGNISQLGEMVSYTFLGRVGQRLVYNPLLPAFSPINVRLTSPSGLSVFGNLAPASAGPLTLAEAGPYTLVIDPGLGLTGPYAFQLLDIATAPALPLGSTVSGTVNPGLSDAVIQFSGTAGRRLNFLSQISASGTWSLYGPTRVGQAPTDQVIASSPLSSGFVANLPVDGTYVLVIQGNSTTGPVNYRFQVTDVSDAPGAPAGFGQVHAGTIAAGQSMTYSLTAPAGLPIFFDGQDGTGNLLATLRDPSGNTVFSVLPTRDAGPYILQRSGNYVLTVQGSGASDSGTYRFQVLDLEDGSTPLALGTPIGGTLSPGLQAVSYSFTVPVGERVVYDALSTASTGVRAVLISAGGNQVFDINANDDNAPVTLVEGTYRFIFKGTSASGGSYNFQLLGAGAAPAVPLDGTVITGTLNPGVSTTLYSVQGSAGDRIFFHSGTTVGSWSWSLYGPGVRQVGGNGFASDFTATLSSDGTYILALSAFHPSGPVPYSFSAGIATTSTNPIPTNSEPTGPTTYTYDPKFNVVTSETDPLGHQTLYQLDPANGNILKITQVVGSGGSNDVVTQFGYDAHGLLTRVIDPNGVETDNAYDQYERLITITYAVGTADQASRHYGYDDAGNRTSVIDENHKETTNTFDLMNHLKSTTDPLKNTTSYTYDPAGNLITTQDALTHITTNAYDVYGNLIKVTDAKGGSTLHTYDAAGNLTSTTDPLGNVTRYGRDYRGRLTRTVDAAGGITRQTYDHDSNLLAVIDPDGNRTQYAYDLLNRLTREVDPLGNATVYTYDADGNLATKTDGNAQQIDYTYDDLNRLMTETWVGTNEVIHYTYDKNGNTTSAKDPFSSLTYTYDNRNRVRTVDKAGTPNTPHVVLTYAYDPAGNALSTSDTVDGVAEGLNAYTYNANNQMTRILQTGAALQTKRVDFSYNPVGEFTSINRYTDAVGTQLVVGSTYSYDGLNRLTGLTHSHGATTLASYILTYDADGFVATNVNPDGTATYTYDPRGQLTGAAYSNPSIPTESYTYDSNGNRLTSGTSVTYQIGANNQLRSDGTYTYQYDDNGSRVLRTSIADGSTESYTYDMRNRLVTVIDKKAAGQQTQRVDYTYDVLNRQISLSVQSSSGTVVKEYVYDRDNVLLEFQGNGGSPAPTLTEHNLYGPAVDQLLARESFLRRGAWLLDDAVGSVRDLVDNDGRLANHITYDSFGNLVVMTNPSVSSPYLFVSQRFDAAIGLYYDRARYYDPAVGRFVSEDPIRFASGDMNLYRYSINNPINFTDPTGNFSICKILCATIGPIATSICVRYAPGANRACAVFSAQLVEVCKQVCDEPCPDLCQYGSNPYARMQFCIPPP